MQGNWIDSAIYVSLTQKVREVHECLVLDCPVRTVIDPNLTAHEQIAKIYQEYGSVCLRNASNPLQQR